MKVDVIYSGGLTKGNLGICREERFYGWLCWQHPDGQWVTLCDLSVVNPVEKSLVAELDQEVYRLAEAHEPHPEIDANSYDLSTLFVKVQNFLGKP